MMKKGNLALSCVAVAVLAACGSDSQTDEEILASGGYILEYELNGETFEVRQANAGHFEIACPQNVVCDADHVYRAHRFADDNLSLYMSFEPSLVGNYSYSNIEQYFNYANLIIRVPSLDSTNSEVYFQTQEPLRELSFDADIMRTSSFRLDLHDFESGYLSGTWSGIITELTERTEDHTDPDCNTGDEDGECYEAIPVTMPFTVRFNLEVEQ